MGFSSFPCKNEVSVKRRVFVYIKQIKGNQVPGEGKNFELWQKDFPLLYRLS